MATKRDEYDKVKPPRMELPNPQIERDRAKGQKNTSSLGVFPYPDSDSRLSGYDYYESLFMGQHFEAFRIKIDNEAYGEAYNKLRYVKINFAGLISKVVADMLFSEPPIIQVPGGDQEFIDALIQENHLKAQFYESSLSNSYAGDALFKIRVGKRHPNSIFEKPTLIIEDTQPGIYFPQVDQFNVRQDPEIKELAWTFKKGDTKYLRKEIHEVHNRRIINQVFEMEGNEIKHQVNLNILGIQGLAEQQQTRVDNSLIIHTPNWKTGRRYFGISDYYDLDALFYAINNRMTKTDNVLDKHTDPILAVPPGVIGEDGRVNREKLGMIEVPEGIGGSEGKPEYIVWNASLENAYKQYEKLIEAIFMVSEISPDTLGMGQGKSDSGRALKFKLLRTIAKVTRKKTYYDVALKELLYTAQVVAKEWGLEVGGRKLKGEPVYPEIKWQDGIPQDDIEATEVEVKRKDAGLTTTKDSLVRLDGLDEDNAEAKAKEIEEEGKVELPKPNNGENPFSNKTINDKANAVPNDK
jgi:hypothetical protein